MRRGLFYIVVAIIAIGIIALNTIDSVKYLTCEDPENYNYTINEVSNNSVEIDISLNSTNETYSDFVYHINDSTLYIGVKFTMNPLNDDADGSYTIQIDIDEEITSIVLKGASKEKVIYPE